MRGPSIRTIDQGGCAKLFRDCQALVVRARDGTVGVNYSVFLLFCVLGSWVICANMQCKLLVALRLKVPHHFIERLASGRAGSLEDPGAFGATKIPKTPLFNPYQLPIHGLPMWLRPTLFDRLIRACRQRTQHSPLAWLTDCSGKPPPSLARRKMSKGTDFTCANLDGLSCILHALKIVVLAQARFCGLV